MKKLLVRVFRREDQTLVHLIAMYVTIVIAIIYSCFVIVTINHI